MRAWRDGRQGDSTRLGAEARNGQVPGEHRWRVRDPPTAWRFGDYADFRMRRHAGKVGRMEMPRLLNLLRQDWWLLAIVICIAWAIEGVIEGNTFREIMIGPVMVILWAGAIFVIDRWVVRIPDQKGTRPPG
jgi:hypothetical protein